MSAPQPPTPTSQPPAAEAAALDWKLQTMLQIRVSMYTAMGARLAAEIKAFKQNPPPAPMVLPGPYIPTDVQVLAQTQASPAKAAPAAEPTKPAPAQEPPLRVPPPPALEPMALVDTSKPDPLPKPSLEPPQEPTPSRPSDLPVRGTTEPAKAALPAPEPKEQAATLAAAATPAPTRPTLTAPSAEAPARPAPPPPLASEGGSMELLRKSLLDMINSQIADAPPMPASPQAARPAPTAPAPRRKPAEASAQAPADEDHSAELTRLRHRLAQLNVLDTSQTEARPSPAEPQEPAANPSSTFNRFSPPPTFSRKLLQVPSIPEATEAALPDPAVNAVADLPALPTPQRSAKWLESKADIAAGKEITTEENYQSPKLEGRDAFQRFVMPEFLEKPATLHLPRNPKDQEAEQVSSPEPASTSIEPAPVGATPMPERITSGSMRRFQDLTEASITELNPRAADPAGSVERHEPSESRVAATAEPSPSAAPQTTEGVAFTTASFHRFIAPSFDEKRLRTTLDPTLHLEAREPRLQPVTGPTKASPKSIQEPADTPAEALPAAKPGERVFEYEHAGVRVAIVLKPEQLAYFTQDPTQRKAPLPSSPKSAPEPTPPLIPQPAAVVAAQQSPKPAGPAQPVAQPTSGLSRENLAGLGAQELEKMTRLLGEEAIAQLHTTFADPAPLPLPDDTKALRARELLAQLVESQPLAAAEGQAIELVNPTDELDLGSQALNDDFLLRINNFQRNLDRLRAKPLPSPTEITLKTIQKKFLEQIVQRMSTATTRPAPEPPTEAVAELAPDALSLRPSMGATSSVDEALARFHSFEPIIATNLSNFREGSHRNLPDPPPDEALPEIAPPEAFATETLAKIHVSQGHPELARRIYEQMALKNPEKSAYFAALIAKL